MPHPPERQSDELADRTFPSGGRGQPRLRPAHEGRAAPRRSASPAPWCRCRWTRSRRRRVVRADPRDHARRRGRSTSTPPTRPTTPSRRRASAGSGSTPSGPAGPPGCVLRLVGEEPMSLEDLGLPAVIRQLSLEPRGLVLVTGPTGSGKTTTLAAMVDAINENRAVHILTIEDPIEVVHSDKLASVNQRELGTDTADWAVALRAAMRQDPDVILIGEMRDADTVKAAPVRRRDRPLRDVDAAHHGRQGDGQPDHRLLPAARAEAGAARRWPPRCAASSASGWCPRADGEGRTVVDGDRRQHRRGSPRRSPTPTRPTRSRTSSPPAATPGCRRSTSTWSGWCSTAPSRSRTRSWPAPTPTTSRSCSSARASTPRSSTRAWL